MEFSGPTRIALILACLLALTSGYIAGPPPSACGNMLPGHPASPQTSQAPYVITLNTTTYSPNEVIQVIISGTGGTPFRGVFIQARRDGSSNPIGKFTVPTGDDHLTAKMCNGVAHNAVGHFTNKESTSKTFYWTAPSNASGSVRFKGTFVQIQLKYWINVYSGTLPSRTTATSTSTTQQLLSCTTLTRTADVSSSATDTTVSTAAGTDSSTGSDKGPSSSADSVFMNAFIVVLLHASVCLLV